MSESEVDTSRVVVQTYVPAYQREEWDDHAEALDMNRSEFVRTMVQAGRRGFGGAVDGDSEPEAESGLSRAPARETGRYDRARKRDDGVRTNGNESTSTDRTAGADSSATETGEDSDSAGGHSLEPRVVDALSEAGCLSWDELLAEVTDDVETRLEATLQQLQEQNSVRYSGPRGGYVLEEGPA